MPLDTFIKMHTHALRHLEAGSGLGGGGSKGMSAEQRQSGLSEPRAHPGIGHREHQAQLAELRRQDTPSGAQGEAPTLGKISGTSGKP